MNHTLFCIIQGIINCMIFFLTPSLFQLYFPNLCSCLGQPLWMTRCYPLLYFDAVLTNSSALINHHCPISQASYFSSHFYWLLTSTYAQGSAQTLKITYIMFYWFFVQFSGHVLYWLWFEKTWTQYHSDITMGKCH